MSLVAAFVSEVRASPMFAGAVFIIEQLLLHIRLGCLNQLRQQETASGDPDDLFCCQSVRASWW